MSWLKDVKPFSQPKKEKRKDWGYLCGYCNKSFFADLDAYEEHRENAHKREFSDVYQKATGDKYHIGDQLAK